MTFDNDGNLYVGVGDDNSSQGAGAGYSGNNWTKDYKGLSFQDARRTAGNTNDLNGKILRIHPEADGTYTIPKGNLFTGKEEGAARPVRRSTSWASATSRGSRGTSPTTG